MQERLFAMTWVIWNGPLAETAFPMGVFSGNPVETPELGARVDKERAE
jgi:hypothetical protein